MKKILIVDDEQDAEFLFRQKFRREIREGELVLHFAQSGDEALKFMSELDPCDIVLVLTDINMPGISGIELLQRIKQKYPGISIIMVSAYDDDINHQHAARYGADGFVTKPIDFEILKEKII